MACEDEATFGLVPVIARGWAMKGKHPVAFVNPECRRLHVFGARSSRAFVFSFCMRKSQKKFVEFLRRMKKRWGRVLLFIDNAPYHRGKLVRSFLCRNRKTFRLVRFPKYTPELNPVEQCWKPARRRLANRLLRTLPAAGYHLRKIFSNPENMPNMFKYLTN